MWKWKEEERKERVWKMHSVAQRRMSEWLGKWDGCRACVCTEARHWLELQQSSHSILHPPHPSFSARSLSLSHSLTHSLTVSRLLTEVFLQAQAGAARNFSEPLLCVCVNSLSSRPPLWILLAWTTALSLLGSEAVDLRVRVRSWTREEQ